MTPRKHCTVAGLAGRKLGLASENGAQRHTLQWGSQSRPPLAREHTEAANQTARSGVFRRTDGSVARKEPRATRLRQFAALVVSDCHFSVCLFLFLSFLFTTFTHCSGKSDRTGRATGAATWDLPISPSSAKLKIPAALPTLCLRESA